MNHKQSLYQGVYMGHRMLICCQVHDLSIGCVDTAPLVEFSFCHLRNDSINLRKEGFWTVQRCRCQTTQLLLYQDHVR
jgi:hypothetical protein